MPQRTLSASAKPPRRAALALALLLASAGLAGCAGTAKDAPPEVVEAVADTRAMTWAPGNFWAYHAIYRENVSFDVALIVHETRPDGFQLGSNLSAGFFGLPFTGNVSSSLNPRIGGEEWPLYRFPLHHEKSWEYTLFGYDAKTVAHAALIDVPGLGEVPGFRLESSAYGQVFARYDYVAEVGWFTNLQLIEPTDKTNVLDVTLRAYGPDWGQAYFVEETLEEITVAYPDVPGEIPVRVPEGYQRVRAFLSVETKAGLVEAQLKDGDGRTLADARAVAKGAASERASARGPGEIEWTLAHKGAGVGRVHLQVTGLVGTGLTDGQPALAESPDGVEIDLLALLQSTRPERPHTGHVTSTGLPVAV